MSPFNASSSQIKVFLSPCNSITHNASLPLFNDFLSSFKVSSSDLMHLCCPLTHLSHKLMYFPCPLMPLQRPSTALCRPLNLVHCSLMPHFKVFLSPFNAPRGHPFTPSHRLYTSSLPLNAFPWPFNPSASPFNPFSSPFKVFLSPFNASSLCFNAPPSTFNGFPSLHHQA